MRLCSVTVTSNTRQAIIGDAIRSVVPFVDGVGLVHILEGNDNTLQVAKLAAGADREWFGRQEFPGMDMAYYRNACLATARGYDWALLLDTDERIHPNGFDIRGFLETVPEVVNAVTVLHESGTCSKSRFFRIPSPVRFFHMVHEEPQHAIRMAMPQVRYSELKKPHEVQKARAQFILRGLEKQLAEEPANYRWHYYKATTLEDLGELEEAARAFGTAVCRCQDASMKGWLCFRLASCLQTMEQFQFAAFNVQRGLVYAPWMAELHWLGGLLNAERGLWRSAIKSEHMAIQHGLTRTATAGRPHLLRDGFMLPRALFEGPFEVLVVAYEALGETDLAAEAATQAARWAEARNQFCLKGVL